MESQEFDLYLERLRRALECAPRVLGLITLGSTADAALRDDWSDHDFWVITDPGGQDTYLNDFAWLPDSEKIAIAVRHKNGWTLLYCNHHKVEFAVLDVEEAREGNIERYRVLIDRGQIGDLTEAIHRQTVEQARSTRARADALQNLCVLVWTACERYSRGEMLSARQYLDGFAVNQLLKLVSIYTVAGSGAGTDELDPRRRLEMRAPSLAADILGALGEPIPAAALGLLNIAEREIKANAPSLAWKDVAAVRDWIADLPCRSGRAN